MDGLPVFDWRKELQSRFGASLLIRVLAIVAGIRCPKSWV